MLTECDSRDMPRDNSLLRYRQVAAFFSSSSEIRIVTDVGCSVMCGGESSQGKTTSLYLKAAKRSRAKT